MCLCLMKFFSYQEQQEIRYLHSEMKKQTKLNNKIYEHILYYNNL